MCIMLYIAADNELPVTKLQEKEISEVYIYDIPEVYAGVKKHFTRKYQYMVGPDCGCTFSFSAADEIDDIDVSNELGRKKANGLFDYIKKYVYAGNCELVSCWTGDEEENLKHNDIIKISEFNWKNKFNFSEAQKTIVYK